MSDHARLEHVTGTILAKKSSNEEATRGRGKCQEDCSQAQEAQCCRTSPALLTLDDDDKPVAQLSPQSKVSEAPLLRRDASPDNSLTPPSQSTNPLPPALSSTTDSPARSSTATTSASTVTPSATRSASASQHTGGMSFSIPQPVDERGIPVAAVVSGIFAGVLLTMVIAFGTWMCSIRKRYPKPVKNWGGNPTWIKPELGNEGCRHEIDGLEKGKPEVEGRGYAAELAGRLGPAQMGEGKERYEVEGNEGARELEAGVRGELEGG
ncbi:MAG: hypothetical protein Q9201_003682 [Fulgogasparrea decipioides]